jgi:hypothetical protein
MNSNLSFLCKAVMLVAISMAPVLSHADPGRSCKPQLVCDESCINSERQCRVIDCNGTISAQFSQSCGAARTCVQQCSQYMSTNNGLVCVAAVDFCSVNPSCTQHCDEFFSTNHGLICVKAHDECTGESL